MKNASRTDLKAVRSDLLREYRINLYRTHRTPYLDAINIDVKTFTDKFYKKIRGAPLAPVLEMSQRMKALALWVEVTTLIIHGLNDAEDELREIARFVKSVGKEKNMVFSEIIKRGQDNRCVD